MPFKVVFLIPPFTGKDMISLNATRRAPHIGVAYLVAMIQTQDIKFKIIDMNLGYTSEMIKSIIRHFTPSLICMTIFSPGHKMAYQVLNRIKLSSDAKIVIGGPHVSVMGQKSFLPSVDYAIVGEGEYSLLNLIEALSSMKKPKEEKFKQINGLIWRRGEEIIENKRNFILDLDNLPFPAFESFEIEKYKCYGDKRLAIVTSRGCPHRCNFCCTNLSMGLRYRSRSPKNVISELEYWVNKGWRKFDFNDDVFTQDKERVTTICQMIIEKKLNIEFNLYVGLRVDAVSEPLLKLLKRAGCKFISYGCESGNDKILKIIKKDITTEQVRKASELTAKVGINHKINFMIGHAGETFDDALQTIKFAKSLPCNFVGFNNLTPYPGTVAYKYVLNTEGARFLYPVEDYLDDLSHKSTTPVFETQEFPKYFRTKALIMGQELERLTLLRFCYGKYWGTLLYVLSKNNKLWQYVEKIRKRMVSTQLGESIYNVFFKSPW